MDTAPSPPSLVWHTCSTDRGYARQHVAAQYRQLFSTPLGWLIAVPLVGLVAMTASDPSMLPVAVPIVLLVVSLVAYAGIRTARLIPVGTVIRAALGPQHLHVEGLVGQVAQVGYDTFRRVVVRGRCVVLVFRATGSFVIVPLDVFPGPVLDELRSRIAAAVPTAEPPPVTVDPGRDERFTATWTTDEGYARRLASASFRATVLTPRKVVGSALVCLLGFMLIGSIGTGGISVVVPGLITLALVPTIFWILSVGTRRQTARSVPVGSTYRLGADDVRLRIGAPGVTLEVTYADLTDLRTRDGIVLLKQRGTGVWLTLPTQVFPGHTLDDLRRRVAATRSGGS
jgi:hypothetical protein